MARWRRKGSEMKNPIKRRARLACSLGRRIETAGSSLNNDGWAGVVGMSTYETVLYL